jgi:two-component system, cell cycle response regulator DivK
VYEAESFLSDCFEPQLKESRFSQEKTLLTLLLTLSCFQLKKLFYLTTMTTVLIVEDDPINFRVFSKILTKRGGLQVKGTEIVEEVLQLAQRREVDAILMDVALANSIYQGKPVDGIKITQMLKSDPQTASLPIVLVTAHAMEGDRENFLKQSGADGYISKPVVDHQEFIDQIIALINKT